MSKCGAGSTVNYFDRHFYDMVDALRELSWEVKLNMKGRTFIKA